MAARENNGSETPRRRRYGRREFLLLMGSSTAGLALMATACASGARPRLGAMNYVGVGAADFTRSIDFYSKNLGIKIFEQAGKWAEPVNGWRPYRTLVWEVLGNAPPAPASRRWGAGCNLRAVLFVDDPDDVVATLQAKGVEFTGDFVDEGWRRIIEFQDADRIPWDLGQAPDFPESPSLEVPCVGGIDIKAADLEAQVDFYTEVMGMTVARRDPQILLVQEGGMGFLTLQPGGQRIAPQKLDKAASGITVDSPLYFSWMTDDVDAAAAHVTAHGAPVLREITPYVFGRVFVTADPDGNLIKLVHYDKGHSLA